MLTSDVKRTKSEVDQQTDIAISDAAGEPIKEALRLVIATDTDVIDALAVMPVTAKRDEAELNSHRQCKLNALRQDDEHYSYST